MTERSETGSSLLTFLLGTAVGVIAGLLFAPRSGRETRERVQDFMEDLQSKGQDLVEEGRHLWEQGKEKIQEKAERTKETLGG
ncbi:MAG: YtxH domain-containing protein [Elusimicrobia bacterium]|nr:YtxH domain-containing protein [Elusimicrobiota bacterium]